MSNFSTVLKQLRLKHNLTQQEFAKKIGISKSSISMYECGQREPDFETLENIADFFNVNMDFLLGKDTYLKSNSENENTLFPKNIVDYAQQLINMGVTDEDFEKIKKFYDMIKDNK